MPGSRRGRLRPKARVPGPPGYQFLRRTRVTPALRSRGALDPEKDNSAIRSGLVLRKLSLRGQARTDRHRQREYLGG